MLLRPRQKECVERTEAKLLEHGNTLTVAPTGAGKTVMLSKLTDGLMQRGRVKRALIMQHRDELTNQNQATFARCASRNDLFLGRIDGSNKDWNAQVAFGMVPTLARNLKWLSQCDFDLAIIDEAHHIPAMSYQKVIRTLKEANPRILIAGYTATPYRGDKRTLRATFNNVADQITIGELVDTGVLVPARGFVIDLGVREELEAVRKSGDEYDMDAVAAIMDREVLNEDIVKHWAERAGDRQTVVFCSTVDHAAHVAEAFTEAGYPARMVWGDMPDAQRRDTLAAFDRCEFQIIVNVMVLTEGWDCQPVSCVVLLRPSSYKSTMMQMIGRGLRRLDPELYPGRVKRDCMILDFGTALHIHGGLDTSAELRGPDNEKVCPKCAAFVPMSAKECALCGHEFPVGEELEAEKEQDEESALDELIAAAKLPRAKLMDFSMREIDLLAASPFQWETFFDGIVFIAAGFDAWGCVINYRGEWHAVCGGSRDVQVGIRHVERGDRMLCLAAADDFIRQFEQESTAYKTKRWLSLPPSQSQLRYLPPEMASDFRLNRYRASCALTWRFNERYIQNKLEAVYK